MIVYRDIITGDEMLSDAFPLKPVLDSDGNAVIRIIKTSSHLNMFMY